MGEYVRRLRLEFAQHQLCVTDKPLSGRYRTRRDLNMHRNFTVSRADVAHLILDACADSNTYDAALYIAS